MNQIINFDDKNKRLKMLKELNEFVNEMKSTSSLNEKKVIIHSI